MVAGKVRSEATIIPQQGEKMTRLLFILISMIAVFLVSCNDDQVNSDVMNPGLINAETSLSNAEAEEDLGWTWELKTKYGDGPETTKTFTTGVRWDGKSDFKSGKIYIISLEQALKKWKDDPEMISWLTEETGNIKTKKSTELSYTYDQGHECDTQLECYYDPTVQKCKADAWLYTGYDPGIEGTITMSHMVYNLTLSQIVYSWNITGNNPEGLYMDSHTWNHLDYQCYYNIRARSAVSNPSMGLQISEEETDNGMN